MASWKYHKNIAEKFNEPKIEYVWTVAYDIHVWGFHEAKYRVEDVETALPLTEWLLNFTKQENSTKHNSNNTLRNTTSRRHD